MSKGSRAGSVQRLRDDDAPEPLAQRTNHVAEQQRHRDREDAVTQRGERSALRPAISLYDHWSRSVAGHGLRIRPVLSRTRAAACTLRRVYFRRASTRATATPVAMITPATTPPVPVKPRVPAMNPPMRPPTMPTTMSPRGPNGPSCPRRPTYHPANAPITTNQKNPMLPFFLEAGRLSRCRRAGPSLLWVGYRRTLRAEPPGGCSCRVFRTCRIVSIPDPCGFPAVCLVNGRNHWNRHGF